MGELITEKVLRARKEHSCFLCNNPICSGESYIRQVAKDGGDIYSMSTHLKCKEIADFLIGEGYLDNEYDYMDFNDACTDYLRDNVCPNCKYWNCGCTLDIDRIRCMENLI